MNPAQSDYTIATSSTSSQQHDNSSVNGNTPMTISQSIQVLQQPQENISMTEYSFFYNISNDIQIYHITCREVSFDTVLSNPGYGHAQSNNSHVFYYQHHDKRIYQIYCEVASYTFIVHFLNKFHYGIESNFNVNVQQQGNLNFSKEILEFYLKRDLIYYLPNEQLNMDIGQYDFIDDGVDSFDTSLPYTSENRDQLDVVDDYSQGYSPNPNPNPNNPNIYQS